MHLVARRYDTGEIVRLELHSGAIRSIHPAGDASAHSGSSATPGGPSLPSQVPWIAPGLVDIQVNGFDGQEFSSLQLTPEKVIAIVRRHYGFGVTGFCPTITTNSAEVFTHAVKAIADACRQSREAARSIVGIHLEGPYMSTEDGPRGAHPREHCRRPNWSEFCRWQEAADGRVTLLTMAVEHDNAAEFISQVSGSGVTVAIGHTAATSAQIHTAVEAGARLSTHLGNGAHRMLRRHPNYLWDQLAEDRLTASIIADGHHLPSEVIKTIVRAKGTSRIVLVSDVSGLAGLPVGRYQSSGCELEILADGRLVIAGQDQLLAGASLPLGVGIANVMRYGGVDLNTAIAMAVEQPLTLLGKSPRSLRPGQPADLVLFDLDEQCAGGRVTGWKVRATLAAGEVVYGQVA